MKKINFAMHAAIPASNPIFFEDILVDKRFMARFSDTHLTDELNIEYIARACADRDVRASVVKMLGNEVLGRVFRELHPRPMIELDRPFLAKTEVYNAVAVAVGKLAPSTKISEAVIVVSELLMHIIKPLGVVDVEDGGLMSTSYHTRLFPEYHDLIVDIWAREIEKTLSESRKLDVGTGKTKIGVGIIADRIAMVGRELRKCIDQVGDYAIYAEDALTLVCYNLLPKETRSSSVGFIPESLIQHPAIKAMAANMTVARIALSQPRDKRVLRSTAFLAERLSQVASFFFESKRYVRVSVREFSNHWKKTRILSKIDNKFVEGILSFNMRGAPASQAVTIEDSVLTSDAQIVDPMDNTTKVLNSHYGTVMNQMDSVSVHKLAHLIRDSMVTSELRGAEEPSLTVIGKLADEDLAIAMQALAIGTVIQNNGTVGLADLRLISEDDVENNSLPRDTEYMFVYKFDADVNHIPLSGTRDVDRFELLDPVEVVAVAPDFEGSVFLTDKNQILPADCMKKRLIGRPDLGLQYVRGYTPFTLSIQGLSLSGGFNFVGSTILNTERDAGVIKPLLNATVVAETISVLTTLLDEINDVSDNVMRVQLKKYLVSFLHAAAVRGVGAPVINTYVEAINDKIRSSRKAALLSEGPINDELMLREIRRVSSLMTEPVYRRAVTLFVLEQILGLLGLVETKSSGGNLLVNEKSGFFERLRADNQFSMIIGVSEV